MRQGSGTRRVLRNGVIAAVAAVAGLALAALVPGGISPPASLAQCTSDACSPSGGGGGGNQPPHAAFTFSPVEPSAGATVTFDASASTDDDRIVSYAWDWDGNGTPDTPPLGSPVTTHAFPAPGNYRVRLFVRDNGGATGMADAGIHVVAPGESSDTGGSTTSSPLPAPEAGRTATAETVWGIVLVKRPGSDEFIPLGEAESIPVGTTIDATGGEVRLVVDNGDGPQSANLWRGIFVFTQEGLSSNSGEHVSASAAPASQLLVTVATLAGGDYAECPPLARTGAGGATPAASRRSTRRRLFARAHGRFRTRGRYGSATVRGTFWQTYDRCDGTLVSVSDGVVTVRSFVFDRTVILHPGASYLARRGHRRG